MTGLYLHRYMPVWKSKLITPVCAICKDSKSKHAPSSMYILGDHGMNSSRSRRTHRSSERSSYYHTYGTEDSQLTRKRCIICVEDKSAQRFVRIDECNHEVCKTCMIAHLSANIELCKVENIPCLFFTCSNTIKEEQIV